MKAVASDPLFGLFITFSMYVLFRKLYLKTGKAFLQPVITASAAIIILLYIFKIPVGSYMKGGGIIFAFLPLATLFLAVPLYLKLSSVRRYLPVMIISIIAGSASGIAAVVWLGRLMGIPFDIYVSLIPKSVTMPLAVGIAEKIGGFKELAAAGVVFTGMAGLFTADLLFKIFGIKNPAAKGLALGTSAHILGTGRAVEMGMLEGSVSSMAVVIAGIITALITPLLLFFIL
ncbi:MAG: LrgB family protein [Spirochaetia bacterium]|jgi:putative effector of murein hydrolase|nr:LrgB family protein [Spirochaetia bacterium]